MGVQCRVFPAEFSVPNRHSRRRRLTFSWRDGQRRPGAHTRGTWTRHGRWGRKLEGQVHSCWPEPTPLGQLTDMVREQLALERKKAERPNTFQRALSIFY